MRSLARARLGALALGVALALRGEGAPLSPRPAAAQHLLPSSLGRRGLHGHLGYAGDALADVAGGKKRGVHYDGLLQLQFLADLKPLLGWPGASVYIYGMDTQGNSPSVLVGDIQGVSSIAAPPRVWLEEAWLQQNLFGDRVSLLVGRYDLNDAFYHLVSTLLFVSNAFAIGPALAQSGISGPSTYPFTTQGARLALSPLPNAIFRAAVFDGSPIEPPPHEIPGGDGVFLIAEAAALVRPRPPADENAHSCATWTRQGCKYEAKLAFGLWYYTAHIPSLSPNESGPSGTASIPPPGSGGGYLIADVIVWGDSTRHVAAFVELGRGDPRVSQIAAYTGGGLRALGLIRGRRSDELGLAVASSHSSWRFRSAQAAAGEPATSAETTIEATYKARITDSFAVQPDVQYVIHPGMLSERPNALVAGFRLQFTR